jgi:phosphoglycolate phosphatase-like HAD superfamily hydrolase
MTVLFWDIDGTLLTTGRAGVPAWDTAVREVVGRDFQLTQFNVAGMTDYQIAAQTFKLLDVSADEAAVRRMVTRYEDLLPSHLPLKRGRVLPNVAEILDHLHGRDGIRSYLLTGNTRRGARAKLTHYKLFDYFADGAFAEDAGDRASIARRAIAMAAAAGPVDPDRVFVIGDTPHDIHCANAIGARTIAVATGGGYSLDELASHNPWRVFAELPSVAEFVELIESPPEARSPEPGAAA